MTENLHIRSERVDSRATINPFGATVTSWWYQGEELLYLSPLADRSGAKPIRGGIPIIFPQFGNGPLPSHGYARVATWSYLAAESSPTKAVFELRSRPESYAAWEGNPTLRYSVALDESLTTTLSVRNDGATPLRFQAALHSYFTASSISSVLIEGLAGRTYVDKTRANAQAVEPREQIQIVGEYDRIYRHAPDTLAIVDRGSNRRVSITKSGFPDVVLWNPGAERCRSFADLPPDGFERFVCLEVGAIDTPVTLAPGEEWEGLQRITVNE